MNQPFATGKNDSGQHAAIDFPKCRHRPVIGDEEQNASNIDKLGRIDQRNVPVRGRHSRAIGHEQAASALEISGEIQVIPSGNQVRRADNVRDPAGRYAAGLTAPQFRSGQRVNRKVKPIRGGRQLSECRARILDQHGARRRPVARPQLRRVQRKKQARRASHARRCQQGWNTGKGENQPGPQSGSVALPQLVSGSATGHPVDDK